MSKLSLNRAVPNWGEGDEMAKASEMEFADVAEVNLQAAELTSVAVAWCSLAAPKKKAGKS
jgi:hypothetical protein